VITCKVEPGQFSFDLNGRPAYSWKGDPRAPKRDNGRTLWVYGSKEADIRFEEAVLEPFGSDPGRFLRSEE
jgi:hypothetical protein